MTPVNESGLRATDISMHLPHPLGSAFDCVAGAAGSDDCTTALNWLDIEEKRRASVSTQGFDSVVYALPLLDQWVTKDSPRELLRAAAMLAIVNTACNWMHPELLGKARDAVINLCYALEPSADVAWAYKWPLGEVANG